ncbi:MAG: phage portal protein [Acidobacteriota bacterium]|nr:phage portal protein [Acidobacteriota bacterium]
MPGPLTFIARGVRNLRVAASGLGAGLFDDRYFESALWGGSYGAGMRITPDSVRRIACAQACVSIIGRNIAQMPLKVFTATARGKELATDCPEYSLLYSRPNDRQTSFEFRQSMQGHFELTGNAYAEKVMDRRGITQKLNLMHPARVTPEVLQNGRMRYKYADPLTSTTRTLVQEEVFHLRNWSDDGYIGLSTIAMGADIFGVAMAAQDYTARFFQNDSKPSLYFQHKDAAQRFKSEEERDKFREMWQRSQTGANRHKTAVLPPGLELKEFGIKPNDAQLLDARKFSRIEICSLFGVPPHLVGETEKAATYASVEQFNIMFAVQCILPRVVVWEQAIQRDILQDDTYSAKFSMAALLRGDNASRTAAYAVAIQNGWLSQNDVRILEDLDPIQGGDTYWRPLAWAPLTQLTNPQPAGAGSSKSKQLDDLQNDDTKKALQNPVVHNAFVLGAILDKSPAEVTAALEKAGLVPLAA